ncbi:MAG: hypothetical protein EBR82_82665, partial [Caulobacteraceae bacterium]|nr:hypothetical protein [Caulobacteraceae bacterium]
MNIFESFIGRTIVDVGVEDGELMLVLDDGRILWIYDDEQEGLTMVVSSDDCLAALDHVVVVRVFTASFAVTHNNVFVDVNTPARHPLRNVVFQMDAMNFGILMRGVGNLGLETSVVISARPEVLSSRSSLD